MIKSEFLDGRELYGDNFSEKEIEKWYQEEMEAYADLGNHKSDYKYLYHELNEYYGFSKIKENKIEKALGVGSAWGEEFLPIIDRIKEITILEPSEKMKNNSIGGIKPKYVVPNVNGKMDFEDNSFDLITCFGTLHHIPNVSFVLEEMHRVLKPNGILLMREPIISMGDWTKKRPGLTKNERGIPLNYFKRIVTKIGFKVISKNVMFSGTSFLNKKLSKTLKKPLWSYKTYLWLDSILSTLLKFRLKYHSHKKIDKIRPSSVYFVLQK